jgi:PKD domain
MKSRKIKQDRKARAIVIASAARVRTARVLAAIFVLVLGVGLMPAFASTAQGSVAAKESGTESGRESGKARTTKIMGFDATPTTITVGATVRDDVSVRPKASRTIEVQARRAGARIWTKTPASGVSTKAGDFTAVYQPTLGVWEYRLVVKASRDAREAVSQTREITAKAPTTPPADTTAPGPVTGLWVKADSSTDTSVALYWVNPTDADFTGVMIRRAVGPTPPATVTDGTLVRDLIDDVPYVVDVTGVNGGTQYSYSFFAHDAANNYAAAANVTYTTTGTPHDQTVPAPVTALTATAPSPTSVNLGWTNPADADFTGVIIRRAAGATAPNYNSGTRVTDTAKADTSFTDTGLIAGVYSYALFSHDAAGNHAAAVNVTVTVPDPEPSVLPTAVLSFTSDGALFDFDASGSAAVVPKTLSTGTLDYGDGTPPEALPGDFGWNPLHSYAAAGTFTVTLTVVDSAGASATTVTTVTVSPGTGAPTATLTGPTAPVTVNTPVVFSLATTGSAVLFWTVQGDSVGFYFSEFGAPPATVTYTFTDPGTYTVSFTTTNAGGESADTSMEVVVQ